MMEKFTPTQGSYKGPFDYLSSSLPIEPSGQAQTAKQSWKQDV